MLRFAALLMIITLPVLAAEPPAGFDQVKDVAHGKIEKTKYASKTVGGERPVVVYTPPGYDPNTKYPVLYLLHGSGDDETGWNVKGSASAILDNLYADASAAPVKMIVVMPYGYPVKSGAKPPTDREERRKMMGAFEADVVDDLIPWVEKTYPVIADAQHRALAGLSMGGMQTMRIALAHPEMFAYVGVFSAPLIEPYPEAIAKNLADPAALNAKSKLFYMACGQKDRLFDRAKAGATGLKEKKVNVEWVETDGAHEWPVWKRNLWTVAPRLFK